MATGLDYYSLREFDSHSFLAKNCICPVTVRFLMIDLDMDYTHDYRLDNQNGVLGNRDYNLSQAIDIVADYLIVPNGQIIHGGIVLIESVLEHRPRSRNCIDREIDFDLVDS